MLEKLRNTLAGVYSFEKIYDAIGVSRQQFFMAHNRSNFTEERDEYILSIVKEWRKNHSKMGSRATYNSLKQAGIELGIGVTKFEQLLSKNKLTVKRIKRFIPKTTDSSGVIRRHSNLTNGLTINDISQLIVSDITYFFIGKKPYFLFLFKDVYSQRVLSIIPSNNMEATNCLIALEEIVELRGEKALENAILHTDNGGQYESKKVLEVILKLKMRISRAANCKQNGSAEQLNHIAKNMYLKNWSISNFEELVFSCKKFKTLNNKERAIDQLGGLTPINFEAQLKKIPIEKRRKKTMHDFSL